MACFYRSFICAINKKTRKTKQQYLRDINIIHIAELYSTFLKYNSKYNYRKTT